MGRGAGFFRQSEAVCVCLTLFSGQDIILFEPGFAAAAPESERRWLQRQTILEMLRQTGGRAKTPLIIAYSSDFSEWLARGGLPNISIASERNHLTAIAQIVNNEFKDWDFLEGSTCFRLNWPEEGAA
jgi:hypothetical protein